MFYRTHLLHSPPDSGRFLATTARNLTLIGMPGSGKSTVGRLLAERLGWAFVDVDQLIESSAGLRLPEIVAAEGFEGLALRERKANSELKADRCVIAPGGSVIYFDEAMENLRSLGPVVYLHVPADLLEQRAGDLVERATIISPGMTFADLAAERDPLYRNHADFVVACGNEGPVPVAERVFELFQRAAGGLDGL